MEISAKWIAIGILFFHISSSSCFYREIIIEDLCKLGNETITIETSKVGSAGTLKATSQPPYKPNKDCLIVIQPPSDKGVVLSVRKIDFRQRMLACYDYIKVYHADAFSSPTTACRFKFDLEEKLSFYMKGPMTILYHVGPAFYPSFNYEEGFTLTYTIISDDFQDCIKDDMYMCGNGRCISNDLTCDGRNNCGDGSDEDRLYCDSTIFYNFHTTDVLYAVIFSVLILSFVVTCGVVVFRRRHRHEDTDSVSDQDEPTARLTPFQAVHPTGFFICQNPAGPDSICPYQSKVLHVDGGFSNPCYPSGVPQPPPPYSQ